jgi:hypothetical protein
MKSHHFPQEISIADFIGGLESILGTDLDGPPRDLDVSSPGVPRILRDEGSSVMYCDMIWLFNIANWKIPSKWRFLAGKIIYKWAIFHGYVK